MKIFIIILISLGGYAALYSQITIEKKDIFFGNIKDFNAQEVAYKMTNEYKYPIRFAIENVSDNLDSKVIEDTIFPSKTYTLSIALFPNKLGIFKGKTAIKFSDKTSEELTVNGYITSFSKLYYESITNNQLTNDKEIVFMIIDHKSQKPIPYAKIFISNTLDNKSFIGYSDRFGILKNKIPEGKYLLQSLVNGYEREIYGRKVSAELNLVQILLSKKAQPEPAPVALAKKPTPKVDTPKIEVAVNTIEPVAKEDIAPEPIATVSEVEAPPQSSESIIAGTEEPSPSLRRPLNIIMLIDNSSSMAYQNRIEQVKESIMNLIYNYKPQDKLAVLTFNEEVHTILPSSTITNQAQANQLIHGIEVAGKTNGEVGVRKAFELLDSIASPESLNMIVLATDGRITNSSYVERSIMEHIESMNKKGNLLSIMGFSNSNFHSRKLQQMADIGGGIYLNMNEHKDNYSSLLLEEIYKTLLKIEQ